MSELSKALYTYIEAERFMAKSDSLELGLQKKHENALCEHGNQGVYEPEDAKKVYDAYNKIEEHRAKVGKMKGASTKAEEIIQKYLLSLKGGFISYKHEGPEDPTFYTYLFSSIDGKVIYNKK